MKTYHANERTGRVQNCTPALFLQVAIALLGLGSPGTGAQSFTYEEAYPGVDYATRPLTDRVTRLMADIQAGRKSLDHDAGGRGYLDSLLAALDIHPDSQILVFSKTALKARLVTPQTPRAVYFNDDTYIAFTLNSRSVEIAAMDPVLGPVFFEFSQDPEEDIGVEREVNRCLRCHDSYSMTGGGVPRFLLSSVLADEEGEIVAHEVSIITDTSTPLNRRWGGMYVTGTHGSQDIMGNFIVDDLGKLTDMNLKPNGNKTDLAEFLDTSPYISSGSDIVALMVMEHQVEVQNRLTRVSFESRTRLHEQATLDEAALSALTRPLLESLFFANEVPLTDTITGSSGFTDYFQALGPTDSAGRSLREFDLQTRTFKYPLSYLVYSEAIDALPAVVKDFLFRDIRRVLSGEWQDPAFNHLTDQDRAAITEILRETKPQILSAE